MWVDSSSGRQFSRITAVDNVLKTVTVATAYGVTESGRNWGIGGKRATLDNANTKKLGADAEPGWVIEIAAGDTQTLTSAFAFTADGDTTTGLIIVRGAAGTRAIVTSATNSVNLFTLNAANRVAFRHLNLTHTAATRGNGVAVVTSGSANDEVSDCVIDGCATGISAGANFSTTTSWLVFDNEVKNGTVGMTFRNATHHVANNYVHDNSSDGIQAINGATTIIFRNNVIVKNGGKGFNQNSTAAGHQFTFTYNTISDNTGDGIGCGATSAYTMWSFANNVIYGNGGWGINNTATASDIIGNRNNFYGSNSSGNLNGVAAGTNDVALTANPFTSDSGSNRDFSLNAIPGGGQAVKGAAYPGTLPGATFTGYPDGGAVQANASLSSGGGASVKRLAVGVR